jgi:ABC-type multidrug transport system ATPase subunit
MGFIYMAVEAIVYYLLFVLIETIQSTKWYPAPFRWGGGTPSNSSTPIHVSELYKTYDQDITALTNVNFDVQLGETLAIVGPNGSGKSSLLGILSGCCRATSGTVTFSGLNLRDNIEAFHRLVGFCPQQNLFIDEVNASEWFTALKTLRGEPDFSTDELISALGLEDQLRNRMGGLSGGNKRKVCLASALLGNPSIVVLDEATSGVDFTSRTRIWGLISSLKDTTVVMATHTLEECEKIADRIMVLCEGQVSVLKTPTELRREFSCGYLIETHEENAGQLRAVLIRGGMPDPVVDVTEGKATVVIGAEEHALLGRILSAIDFPYLMAIQNLEERIFSHIQEQEMQQLRRRMTAQDAEDEDLHQRV